MFKLISCRTGLVFDALPERSLIGLLVILILESLEVLDLFDYLLMCSIIGQKNLSLELSSTPLPLLAYLADTIPLSVIGLDSHELYFFISLNSFPCCVLSKVSDSRSTSD